MLIKKKTAKQNKICVKNISTSKLNYNMTCIQTNYEKDSAIEIYNI